MNFYYLSTLLALPTLILCESQPLPQPPPLPVCKDVVGNCASLLDHCDNVGMQVNCKKSCGICDEEQTEDIPLAYEEQTEDIPLAYDESVYYSDDEQTEDIPPNIPSVYYSDEEQTEDIPQDIPSGRLFNDPHASNINFQVVADTGKYTWCGPYYAHFSNRQCDVVGNTHGLASILTCEQECDANFDCDAFNYSVRVDLGCVLRKCKTKASNICNNHGRQVFPAGRSNDWISFTKTAVYGRSCHNVYDGTRNWDVNPYPDQS